MRIDLHAHSTASDGTSTPAELMAEASVAGLDVVAITDHDTTGGWAQAAAALPVGLRLVRGAELSCRWYDTEPSVPLHLLAYLFDPGDEELAAEMARLRAARRRRAHRIVELLRADDIDVSWEEVTRLAAGGSVGRPHIAQARASVRGRIVPDSLIVELAGVGLFGLEADHEDHSPEERAHVRGLAGELGLVVTGSSDFHGRHKSVWLGAHTTAPEAYERIVAAAGGAIEVLGG
jgi:predicted metal-dependent phosphoesterase TrpH